MKTSGNIRGEKVANEQAIRALQRGKILITGICDSAIKAAIAFEQAYDGHAPPWNDDYCPFDFCVDMDELKEKVLLHSDRFIELSRWIKAHDFNPLDEIAAIRHEEAGLSEHEQSSPLYLLAIESRNPWVIVDDASPEIDENLQPCTLQFLGRLIFQWNEASSGRHKDPEEVLPTLQRDIDELVTLPDYPFLILPLSLKPLSSKGKVMQP
ncbi:hypothetical protein [Alcanivorax sp.]|uniref:hypothetical protein n=1 Tax=Alcanivorax sp. TaxID=1872427 RepID=UPI0025BCAF85|nr:hypothetical protein [Alcanivorax sp.]